MSAPRPTVTLTLTVRQAEALGALAALEDLPPEAYAAEVLAKHLYHAYTPQAAQRAAARTGMSPDAAGEPSSRP